MHGLLYEPLGLKPRSRRTNLRVSPRSAGTTLAVGLVLGASLFAALDQPPVRTGDMLAEADAVAASRVTPATSEVPPAPQRGGATIIRGVPASRTVAAEGPSEPVTFEIIDPQSQRQPQMIAHLADPELLEASDAGPLPIRSADGRRPFDVYSGEWSGHPGRRIAIVVGGIGISQTGSQSAVRTLPKGVTLAFAPSGNSLDRWMQEARRKGHELLLQVPLEPVGYPEVDPGERTLTVDAAASGDFTALFSSLGRMTNYVGIVNYMGGRFSTERPAMEALMGQLSERGLMYLDDAGAMRSLARETALAGGVPEARASLVLDQSRDPAEIRKKLDELERISRAEGTAVGMASAFDSSISTIAAWAAEAQQRGIEIVPVSALAYDPIGG